MSPPVNNLFASIPDGLAGRSEFSERLAGGDAVRVERIVSRGHASPPGFWYDQAESEWVLMISGRARLHIENQGTVELVPGDHLTIPPHARHRVEWTAPDVETVWVAVFF